MLNWLQAEGKANPSFLTYNLEALHRDGPNSLNTAEDIKAAAGLMYCAAADTTWSSLSIFFLAMVLHPECQRLAQDEIDTVIGSDRLPTFDGRASLPYVECVLQEILRWNTALPQGIPHRSVEDDIYCGMWIPKGSTIIANTRGMTLDENVYADPFKFNPFRFFPEPKGKGEPYPDGPFGFGRRICPGRHIADASMWIAVASILATLSISKAVDESGKEITPEVAFTSGITCVDFYLLLFDLKANYSFTAHLLDSTSGCWHHDGMTRNGALILQRPSQAQLATAIAAVGIANISPCENSVMTCKALAL